MSQKHNGPILNSLEVCLTLFFPEQYKTLEVSVHKQNILVPNCKLLKNNPTVYAFGPNLMDESIESYLTPYKYA